MMKEICTTPHKTFSARGNALVMSSYALKPYMGTVGMAIAETGYIPIWARAICFVLFLTQ